MSFPQLESDKRAICQFAADWADAMRLQDCVRLAGMVTEDVVFLPPGFPPIRGRDAVEAMYRSFFPQFSDVDQTSTIEEVGVLGDWAFIWGTETTILTPRSGDPAIEMSGRGMSILQRQSDGTWRFARSINNISAPARRSQ